MTTRPVPGGVDVDPVGSSIRSASNTPVVANKMPAVANNGIVNVWADNLREEFKKIIQLVEEYPYVAMVGYLYTSYPSSGSQCLFCRTPSSRVSWQDQASRSKTRESTTITAYGATWIS